MKTEDAEVLGRQGGKPSKIKVLSLAYPRRDDSARVDLGALHVKEAYFT